MQKIW